MKAMLTARTDSDGNPKKGYGSNVRQIKSMIAGLEAIDAQPEPTNVAESMLQGLRDAIAIADGTADPTTYVIHEGSNG